MGQVYQRRRSSTEKVVNPYAVNVYSKKLPEKNIFTEPLIGWFFSLNKKILLMSVGGGAVATVGREPYRQTRRHVLFHFLQGHAVYYTRTKYIWI